MLKSIFKFYGCQKPTLPVRISRSFHSNVFSSNDLKAKHTEFKTSVVYARDVKAKEQKSYYFTDYDFAADLNKKCLNDDGWQISHIVPFCDAREDSSITTHYIVVATRPKIY